jgi:hypothetical protein
MPAHAVGEDGDAELGIDRDAVLVELTHAARIRESGNFDEPTRHRKMKSMDAPGCEPLAATAPRLRDDRSITRARIVRASRR